MMISELYRYPLKGGRGEPLSSSPVLPTGFPHDRAWLLVDASGRFISQRSHPALALVKTSVDGMLSFESGGKTLSIQPGKTLGSRKVTVWDDEIEAWDLGDEGANFFSDLLGQSLRLCAMKPGSERIVDSRYTDSRSVPYLFADGFPYLIISQESLDQLNDRLSAKGLEQVSMDRFRPNIVIKGWQAHGEDTLQNLAIGSGVVLRLADPCSRCNVIVVDQNTGLVGKEPLATLATYRKMGGSKIYFGMNAWLMEGAGREIHRGDPVKILPNTANASAPETY